MNDKLLYFASSNSMNGFQSYFDLIYNSKKLKKIYIIKGGPGTGKSSIIKGVGEKFDKEFDCEYFLCSSDPKSFDGVIIDDKIAVIDGTSPHAVEARYPVAVETLIDTAKGIRGAIEKENKKIKELCSKKSLLYQNAYSYLRAAGEIKRDYIKIVKSDVDEEKLESAITRLIKQNVKSDEEGQETIRLTKGITPNGTWSTGSFEKQSKISALIINSKGCEEIILEKIRKKLSEESIKRFISFDPLLPYSVNSIFIPCAKMSIGAYEEMHGEVDYDKYKIINFERFINKKSSSEKRGKMRFFHKCYSSMIDEAVKYLLEASAVHKELEDVYKEYMNYDFALESKAEIIRGIEASL